MYSRRQSSITTFASSRRVQNSAYSYDAFDQNTLIQTTDGSNSTSIVRVGNDFEYDVSAGRANKYFSVNGVRIAELATLYTPYSASVPPILRRLERRVRPLAPSAAVLFVAVGFASLAGIVATRRRPPVWVAVPGVGLLAVMLVTLPYEAIAWTLPLSGPGTFGRPAEPFLAYITDHLGSVRAVVNQFGVARATRDYDPFGSSIAHTGTLSDQHRFAGEPQDDQGLGLYNYGARFYNPMWGRFISPDEVVGGFDSQGLNPYAYVLNNPTSRVDPDGHQSASVGGDISVGGSVGLGAAFSFATPPGGSFGAKPSSGTGVGVGNGAIPGSLPRDNSGELPPDFWTRMVPFGPLYWLYRKLTDPSDYPSGGGSKKPSRGGDQPPDSPATAITVLLGSLPGSNLNTIPTSSMQPTVLASGWADWATGDAPIPNEFYLTPPGTTWDEMQRARILKLQEELQDLRFLKGGWEVVDALGKIPEPNPGIDKEIKGFRDVLVEAKEAATELAEIEVKALESKIEEDEAELRSYGVRP